MAPPSGYGKAQRRIPLNHDRHEFLRQVQGIDAREQGEAHGPCHGDALEETIVQAEEVIEENSGAASSGDVVQEIPARAILGQTSGVDALRARL